MPCERLSTSYDDSGAAHVATAVDGAQRYRVLARAVERQVERVRLTRAVGDAVFGEDRAPLAAVHRHVCAAHAPRGVFDGEADARAPVGTRLRLPFGTHDRWCAVHVNGFADA